MDTKPAWSFSSIKKFDQCPKQYYHLKVKKDYKENFETEAILYGNQFHKAAEDFVSGTADALDARFEYAQAALQRLRDMEGEKLCEFKMGLTSNLEPCGFFGDGVWLRVVADLIILNKETETAYLLDYKTGKNAKYADKGQLELGALAVFKHFPWVKRVKAGLLFVVCNAFIKDMYEIDSEQELWSKWAQEYGKLEKAYENDVWNPRPTGLCKAHCIVITCPHNGKR